VSRLVLSTRHRIGRPPHRRIRLVGGIMFWSIVLGLNLAVWGALFLAARQLLG
jgi:hypothetical protein